MPQPTPAAVPPQPPAAAPVAPAAHVTPPAPAATPAAPATPPKPASQTPPATPSGASPTPPAAGQEDKVVPITALHEEREKRQQLQAQLDAMKRVMANNVLFDANGNPVMQAQQPQQQQQPQYEQQIEKLWETDPRKAVQAEIYAAMAWRDSVDAQVEQQAGAVSEKNSDFNNYRGEVMTYLRTLPIDQRGRPGIVEAAYYFIKGQKVDNIVARTRQEMEQEYLRKMQAGEFAQMLPAGSTGAPPAPAGAVTLTEDQRKAAAAMRIPEAEYAKWIQNK